jgi:hypothetical protein
MTIQQWFREHGHQAVATAEGRGAVYLTSLGNGQYAASLTGERSKEVEHQPGETPSHYATRVEQELSDSVFNGSDSIASVVNWFATQVGWSDQETAAALSRWKPQTAHH